MFDPLRGRRTVQLMPKELPAKEAKDRLKRKDQKT
jgi:hypothetical protein